jgi:hypothetical protein
MDILHSSRDLHGNPAFNHLGAPFTGQPELASPLLKAHEHEHEIGISHMHYEAHENSLFVGLHDNSLKVYDLLLNDLVFTTRKSRDNNIVTAAAYDRWSRIVVIANSTGGATVYNCATCKVMLQQQFTQSAVKVVIVVPVSVQNDDDGEAARKTTTPTETDDDRRLSDAVHVAALTANSVQVWVLRRNVRYKKLPHAHDGAVMHLLAHRSKDLQAAAFSEGFEELIFRYAPRRIPILLLRAFPYPKSRAGAGTLHSLNSLIIFRYIEM